MKTFVYNVNTGLGGSRVSDEPEWMSWPVDYWDDETVLKWLKERREESPLPAVYPLTVEEMLKWLESKGSRADMVHRTLKYWLNEYYKEMRDAVKP